MFKLTVFDRVLVVEKNQGTAERYAEAIRRGLWQCNITGEPWIEGVETVFADEGPRKASHICDENCCDTRTDDEVKVEAV